MSWTIADIPDLTSRVAVVTGANGGLGLETTRALAGAKAHVVMAARDQAKAQGALAEIRGTDPEASLEVVELDLGSLESVRDAAAEISVAHPSIDILVNNAGVMAVPEGRTSDGWETQLGINHLGHWVLTADLLRSLLAAEAARVVSVTSTAHHFGRQVDQANPNMEGDYDPWRAYYRSKLANYYFALGLQREFERRALPAQSLVAHPGLSRTNLQVYTVEQGAGGRMGAFFERRAARAGMDPADGALPQLRAATDPDAKGGEMYAPRFIQSGPPVRRPIMRRIGLDGAIDNLWSVSEQLTGERLDFAAG
jgi:NAD(P)-dependent dehydrogenase (short-subunit alcohol dehydrogenase family)